MSLHIDTSSFASAKETDQLHHIPCKIDYNGQAKVEQFFSPSIRTSENGMHASFHGRPLDGEQKQVPEGYTGLVLKEKHKVYDEEEDRELRATHVFKNYTHWNLDMPPGDNDKVVSALQWIEIAKAIHDPVEVKNS